MMIVPVDMKLVNKMCPTLKVVDFFMAPNITHALRFGCLYGELSPDYSNNDGIHNYLSINITNVTFRINRFIIESKEKVFMEIDLEHFANGLVVYTAMQNNSDCIVFEPRAYYAGLTDFRLITVDARVNPEYNATVNAYRGLIEEETKPWERS